MSTALLNLLFAQTIYKHSCEHSEYDGDQFAKLAQDLKEHPLNTEFNLSPEACRSLYSALLPSNPSKPTPSMLKPLLAKLYESFKRDIVIQIKNDEHEFRTKLREIEQIERGKWDTELMKEMENERSQYQQQQQQLKLQRELQQRQELQKQKHLQEQQENLKRQREQEEEGDSSDSSGRVTRGSNKRQKRQPSSSPAENKRFQSSVMPLLNNIASNKSASFFANPVNPNDAPKYYDLVYSPTDLRTIKAKVKDGMITTKDELERELENMFANAVMYNKWDSDMTVWAREMQLETEGLISMFRGVQSDRGK